MSKKKKRPTVKESLEKVLGPVEDGRTYYPHLRCDRCFGEILPKGCACQKHKTSLQNERGTLKPL